MSFTPICGPVPFDPSDSIIGGMSRTTLQANLEAAQVALAQLNLGGKVATVSVSQADGSRTVSYQVTNLGQLTAWIRLLQAGLGINVMGRRPVRFNF